MEEPTQAGEPGSQSGSPLHVASDTFASAEPPHASAPNQPPRRSQMTNDESSMFDRLVGAKERGQTLDQLEKSAGKVTDARQAIEGDPTTPWSLVWQLGEAATSVTDQLCDKAEIGVGAQRAQALLSLTSKSQRDGVSVVELLIRKAQAIEARDVGFF